MKHKRTIDKICAYLEAGPRTTREIYDHINRSTYHGINMCCLSNLMAQGKMWYKSGQATVIGIHSYQVAIWELKVC